MSAHTLLNLPTNAIIQTGLITTNNALTTNVVFGTPFPSGALPLVFIQNTEGGVNPTIFFTTQNLGSTGFTIVQTYVSPITTYQSVGVSWVAIAIPNTPIP